jgi:hypothetical protein
MMLWEKPEALPASKSCHLSIMTFLYLAPRTLWCMQYFNITYSNTKTLNPCNSLWTCEKWN